MPPDQQSSQPIPQPVVPPVQPPTSMQSPPAASSEPEPALYVPQPVQAQPQAPVNPEGGSKGVNKWAIAIILGIALVFFVVVLVIAATAGKK